jgi:hypothetical protein
MRPQAFQRAFTLVVDKNGSSSDAIGFQPSNSALLPLQSCGIQTCSP